MDARRPCPIPALRERLGSSLTVVGAQAAGNRVGRAPARSWRRSPPSLARLRFPRTSWLALAGEPGIGKTRLLAAAGRAKPRSGAISCSPGRGAELERELPFGVWVDALDDHAAELGRDRLERLVGDRIVELGRVLPAAAEGRPEPGGLQHERYRAHRAVRTLLQGLAGRARARCSCSTTSTGPTTPRSS